MQPLEITINGDFWDCQIYRGRLYLWKMDGALAIYDWDRLIEEVFQDEYTSIAYDCAFKRGDYLYRSDAQEVFGDHEFKNILFDKFERAALNKIVLDDKVLERYVYGKQQNPFSELPTDTDLYFNNLYATTDDGFYKVTAHRSNKKYPVSTKPKKIWDCPLLSLKTSRGGRIALSAGNEGLFEYDAAFETKTVYDRFRAIENSLYQIDTRYSLFSNWSYASIYSSSDISKSFMAAFNWRRIHGNRLECEFKGFFDDNYIFREDIQSRLSWGTDDKIYLAETDGLSVCRFVQRNLDEEFAGFGTETPFIEVEKIPFMPWKGSIIGGGIAYFGTIVECEHALVVLLSNGESITIDRPVTRWRIYPRAIRYENHLHVIFDDSLKIYSFNHDYFIDQIAKKMGLAKTSFDKRGRR